MYRLVLVDDEPFFLNNFAKSFRWDECGFTLSGAFRNSHSALEYIRANPVDVVITDINMPMMSGLDLCEIINSEFPKTKLVILSGYKEFEYAQSAIEYRVFKYLLKPVCLADVRSLCEKLIEDLDTIHLITESRSEQLTDESADIKHLGIVGLIKKYVEEHYSEEISLTQIAETLSFNSSYLSRCFSQRTGEKFIDYLNMVRIEKAKELLRTTDLKVYEICKAVGYHDINYFNKIFKLRTGHNPQSLRGEEAIKNPN